MAFEPESDDFEFGDIVRHRANNSDVWVVLGQAPADFEFEDDYGDTHEYEGDEHFVLVRVARHTDEESMWSQEGITMGMRGYALVPYTFPKKED